MRRIWEAHRDYSGAFPNGQHYGCFGPRMACSIAETHIIDQGGAAESPPHGQQRPVSPESFHRSVCAMGAVGFALIISVFDRGRFRCRAPSAERCRSTCPWPSRRLDIFRLRRTGSPYHQSAAGLLASSTAMCDSKLAVSLPPCQDDFAFFP